MSINALQVFVALYAIFWGVILSTSSKLRPFRIDGFMKGPQAARKNFVRYLCGIAILNIAPALWFILLLNCDFAVQEKETWQAMLASAFAALSVFAFLNFGYAIFGANPCAEKLKIPEERKNDCSSTPVEEPSSSAFFLLGFLYTDVFLTLAALASHFA